MFSKSVLVTGCNRGIGLEFIKQLANRTQHLFAACRDPDRAEELQNISAAYNNVTVLKLDVTQQEDIELAVSSISNVVGDEGLNCIINNAGVVARETFEMLTKVTLNHVYSVNSIGPTMVAKAFFPLLRQASSLVRGSKMSVSRAAILNISSKAGSIDNSSGKDYAYRMSKAALNMSTKNLSIESKRDKILTVLLHPGLVLTDMGPPGSPSELIESSQCVEGMLRLMSDFKAKDNGSFYDWKGNKIPW